MSLFYEAVGPLLAHGGQIFLESAARGTSADERSRRDLRQVALLLRRVGAIWPDVFESLYREIDELESALAGVERMLRSNGVDWRPVRLPAQDPLLAYRLVLTDLERAIVLLHGLREPWATQALRAARRGLARAADVQGELVDRALGVAHSAPTGR